MSAGQPWYVTLFERDWHDLLAPGGTRSSADPEPYEQRTDAEVAFIGNTLALPEREAFGGFDGKALRRTSPRLIVLAEKA